MDDDERDQPSEREAQREEWLWGRKGLKIHIEKQEHRDWFVEMIMAGREAHNEVRAPSLDEFVAQSTEPMQLKKLKDEVSPRSLPTIPVRQWISILTDLRSISGIVPRQRQNGGC